MTAFARLLSIVAAALALAACVHTASLQCDYTPRGWHCSGDGDGAVGM